MKKLLIILGYEIRTVSRRPAYLFFAFGLPLIILVVLLGINLFKRQAPASESAAGQPDSSLLPEGFVDHSGLVVQVPPDIPDGILTAYETEDRALQALQSGKISAYYVIPVDYLARGEFEYVRPKYNVLTEQGQQGLMRWTLMVNLSGGDLALAYRLANPAVTTLTDLSVAADAGLMGASASCPTPGFYCESSLLLRYLPTIFMFIFFIAIFSGASMLVYGVAGEKENRVMEVLLLSASPVQLMGGKILGFGVLGLLQTAVWLGTAYLALTLGADTLSVPEGFHLPASIWVWGLLFFLLGYAVYAGLMAAAGALLPDIKSYSGVAMIVGAPCYVAYMATFLLSSNPHGVLATGMSIFPLTAPLVMIWRLVQGGVAVWQPTLAVSLLVITAVFVARGAASIFSTRELLSGQPFKLGSYLRLLFRQV